MRVILKNPIYTGVVRWDLSRWKLNEASGTKRRTHKPVKVWERYTYREESYRIVSDEVFAAAQSRLKILSNPDARLKSGGKAVYRLSGLLKCGICGHNYVIDGATHYGCASAKSGACTNKLRQRRDVAERLILGEIEQRLMDPKLVMMMAKEIERELNSGGLYRAPIISCSRFSRDCGY